MNNQKITISVIIIGYNTKNYLVDSSTTTFSTGEQPGTLASIIVSVDGVTKKITTDYTIDVANKTITFNTAPATGSVVSIRTFAISGENYRVLDTYTGDGSTVQYTTATSDDFNLDSTESQLYITIDGVPNTAFTSSSVNQNGVGLVQDVSGITYGSGYGDIYGRVNASVTECQLLQKKIDGSTHSGSPQYSSGQTTLRGMIIYSV